MFKKLKTLLTPKISSELKWINLEADVLYAIGAVHGCYEELRNLLEKVEADIAKDGDKKYAIVFLGDLIDRGPDSFSVLEYLKDYAPESVELVFLKGNHEEVFESVVAGSTRALKSWFGFGGRACLRSYKVDNLGQIQMEPERLIERIQKKVPTSHLEFLSTFHDYAVFGRYLCVHAGIRPNASLETQKTRDLRWIRDEFLDYKKPHPYIVVHGHTISDKVELLDNRIPVDTGAYNNQPLSAVKISSDTDALIVFESKVFEKEAWSAV